MTAIVKELATTLSLQDATVLDMINAVFAIVPLTDLGISVSVIKLLRQTIVDANKIKQT